MSTNICLNNWDHGNSTAHFKPNKKSEQNLTKSSCNNGYHHDWRPYSGSRKINWVTMYGRFKFDAPALPGWAQHNTGLQF